MFLLNMSCGATQYVKQMQQAPIHLNFKSWLPWQRKQTVWCPGLRDFLDHSTRRGTICPVRP